MSHTIYAWILFNLFVVIMLALDLGVFQKKDHEITVKEALKWSCFWIALALIFNVLIYFWQGSQAAVQFLTGYLVEKSLSIDNIFVFLLLFTYFKVPTKYQHKVLFWGVFGALIMRAGFIWAGVALIQTFHWVIFVFGAFLVVTGIKMALEKDKEIHPERNPVLTIFHRFFPVTKEYVQDQFFIKEAGKWIATPLFVVLLLIETTDLIFAVDSIPAILAITLNPFIVYTSNVFAILGLRSLYFALAGAMSLFHYLHYGLSTILVFVGVKMLLSDIYHISNLVALAVIASILAVSVLASLRWPQSQSSTQS